MLHIKRFFLLLSFLCFSLPLVFAKYEAKIAAVVQKEIITESDIESRIALILMMTQQENTAEARNKLKKQVLDILIVETLQIAEVQEKLKKEGVVTEDEIKHYLKNIAAQNKMSIDDFLNMIKDHNEKEYPTHIDMVQSFKNQIKAQISWAKLVEQFPVVINDTEIDRLQQRIEAQKEGAVYDLSEITLYFKDLKEKGTIKKNIDSIMKEIKKGVSFYTLAQQFSQSTSANLGGKIGRQGLLQMTEKLRKTIKNMNAGDVQIVEHAKSFQLIKLNACIDHKKKNEDIVSFKVATLPFNENMTELDQIAVESKLNQLKKVSSVKDFVLVANDLDTPLQSVDSVSIDHLEPEEFKMLIKNAKQGDILPPVRSENGLQVIYIEEKGTRQYKALSPVEIKQTLQAKKKNEFAAMYMNKLRGRTFIDIK